MLNRLLHADEGADTAQKFSHGLTSTNSMTVTRMASRVVVGATQRINTYRMNVFMGAFLGAMQ